jgi:hypothetical protein
MRIRDGGGDSGWDRTCAISDIEQGSDKLVRKVYAGIAGYREIKDSR